MSELAAVLNASPPLLGGRENAALKARRMLLEGRVLVSRADRNGIIARVRGDTSIPRHVQRRRDAVRLRSTVQPVQPRPSRRARLGARGDVVRQQLQLGGYRDEVIDAARSHGEQLALAVSGDWAELAAEAIRQLADVGQPFTADDVVLACGPTPSPGAAGAVFREASRRGEIACVGFSLSAPLTSRQRRSGVGRALESRRVADGAGCLACTFTVAREPRHRAAIRS